jgi:hypothetical protein
LIRRLIQRLIDCGDGDTDIDTDVEMEIATCSDIDTELETNMERVAINDYFRGVDANTLSSLHDTNRLREKRKSLNCAINTTT